MNVGVAGQERTQRRLLAEEKHTLPRVPNLQEGVIVVEDGGGVREIGSILQVARASIEDVDLLLRVVVDRRTGFVYAVEDDLISRLVVLRDGRGKSF